MVEQNKTVKNLSTHLDNQPIGSSKELLCPANITTIKKLNGHKSQYERGRSYLQRGHFLDAYRSLQQALAEEPGHEGALSSLADVYNRLGNYDKAVDCYKRCIHFHPHNHHTHQRLGDTYQSIGRPDDAAYAYAAALRIQPNDANIIASLALALSRLGKKEQALVCYQKAISCCPDDHTLYNQYATILEKCNRLTEARSAVVQSLSHQPNNFGAIANLATIEYREGNYTEAYKLYSQLDLNGRTFEAAATIKQQEGLALDKLGRYSEAFDCFHESNQFAMQTPAYRYLQLAYEDDLKHMEQMADRFPKTRIASWGQQAIEANPVPPVFLVGFPRSGTTLMEQVLNAHPRVFTLDERSPLGLIASDFLTNADQIVKIDDLSDTSINQYRQHYFEALHKLTGCFDKDCMLIDKLPLNILYLPLIYRFFPDSKIIVALRHPLDCIISNYIQRFKLNKKMMNFLTLHTASRFYNITMGLYLSYRELVPLLMHEIKYEDLTENLKGETRNLTDFLEIEWSPAMLQYHSKATNRVINTPSYTEVIKPIHCKAVYRWKNYRRQLAPILPDVKTYIDQLGYRE
jgi:tetratricopeptide (TPR) repeat protein